MRRRIAGWMCIVAASIYVSQPCLVSLGAAAAPDRGEPVGSAPAQGERVAVAGDSGEPVMDTAARRPREHSAWPWIAGAAAVVAAGLGGWIIADKTSNNSKKADDAATAAAASAASAQTAAQAAAQSSQAAATNGQPQTPPALLAGTFTASQQFTATNGVSFTPSITFSVSHGNYPGGVLGYTSSGTGLPSNNGGDYVQMGPGHVLIRVNDPFYLGRATILSSSQIRLDNNTVLTGAPGSVFE